MHADVAIMGAGGITMDGITNSHALLIEIQLAMMRAAQRVVFCLDHTKFGRRSMGFVCPLDEVKTVVTDHLAPAELIQQFRDRQISVVVAEPPAAR
jgi:DeoR/GlpR family transcriptional regulator of sugar metabolism